MNPQSTDGKRVDCRCPRARHHHGTPACRTVCGCRCFPCRVAYAAQARNRRAGSTERNLFLVPRAGTRRRLEALHAIGWSGRELGQMLGVSFQAVYLLRTKPDPLYPTTAATVAALYDQLWDKPSTGPHTTKTLRWARRQGFLPPLAWDDDTIDEDKTPIYKDTTLRDPQLIDPVAVDEAIRGRAVALTRPELTDAIDTMTRMGLSAEDIADRLGVTARTVVRTRRATGPIRHYRKAA